MTLRTIKFEETTNTFLIEAILNDPKLLKVRLGHTREKERYQFNHKYFVIKKDKDEIIGLINYQALNERTIIAHLNILPEYWHKHVSLVVCAEFRKIIKRTKLIRKVITTIPSRARHARLFARRIGMAHEATIKDACYYANQLDDFYVYSLTIE